jgi:transcriptional regulator with XRE-family HTH domain
VKELLILLGKRVHGLRVSKKWSQEEFAHVGGLHRTYIGQVERGEKNISFANLFKLSTALGVSLSQLLSGLEEGGAPDGESKLRAESGSQRTINAARRSLELKKLMKRLSHQQAAMDRTVLMLERLTADESETRTPTRGRPKSDRTGRPKRKP